MAYDRRCYNLAEVFLSDTHLNDEHRRNALAQYIQTTIEAWIEDEEIEQNRRELNDHTISAHGAKYTR